MPIEEYVKEAFAEKGKSILVEMKSIQRDMTGTGLFSVRSGESPDGALKDAPGGQANEYSLVSEGRLWEEEGRLFISYEEAAAEDTDGFTTLISFERAHPECVTVERRGAFSSAFVISGGERLFSVYSTPFGAIDMCIYAKKVENTVNEEGGILLLDYAVELKGLTAQRTRMEVKVRGLSK